MKSKFLPILLFLLILLNVFLIFMLINKPHENKKNNSERNFLTEKLSFSDIQKEQFSGLDSIHRNLMMGIESNIRNQKEVLFNSFQKENFNVDSLATEIGFLEGKKESEIFRFFKEVRTLCTKKQAKKFDKIIEKALKNGRNHPPEKEGMPPPPPR